MLLTLSSCNSPTVKDPVESCVTSNKFQVAKCGQRNLDYTKSRESTGEWVDTTKLEIKPLDQMSDQVCFSLESWLTKIKPTLKEGHDVWANKKKKAYAVTGVIDNESVKLEEVEK